MLHYDWEQAIGNGRIADTMSGGGMTPRPGILGRSTKFFGIHVPLLLLFFLLVAVCCGAGYLLLSPLPNEIVISTGVKGGAYAFFGERYRKILARERVKVRVLNSSGSVENLERLIGKSSPRADAGFVQNGAQPPAESGKLVSLGAICYSPLWIFYRGVETLDDPSQLKGKKIAIGAVGSGVRSFAQELFRVAGLTEPAAGFLSLQGESANGALLKGTIDAVVIIGTEDNGLVRQLLYTPSIKLMNISQAEAYARLIPALSHVVLPRGILNTSINRPASDVHLLSATTSLIARSDLHPSLVYVLLDAEAEAHGPAGWLNRRGEFPTAKEIDFPLSPYAERFYKSGRPFLLDYLPLRLATIVDRLAIVFLPIAFLIGPAFFGASMLYTWKNRRKLYRHYRQLKSVEARVTRDVSPEEGEELKKSLDRIENSLDHLRISSAFFPEFYILKEHLELVRNKLSRPAE